MKILTRRTAWIAAALLAFAPARLLAQTNTPPDLSKDRVLYVVGYAHLDTQWRWTYPQVIREFLPNTVEKNVPLFYEFSNYVFNFTGANRYRMLKEYSPAEYAKIREWVAKGQWWPGGSSWEENDVNSPAVESLIRQVMFGHNYFKQEFGTESWDYMLPDCFGFPASLPSVLAHCGIRGFSTQKLVWHCAVGIPFNVGRWVGPDGESVIAALNPGSYSQSIPLNLSSYPPILQRLNDDGAKSGIFADYLYYGTGDTGGSPTEESVAWVQQSVNSSNAVRVISARSDQMFRDITDAQKARLPAYSGDLLLTEHSAGSITSEAYMKRWNHMNELLADAAEKACVAAQVLGAAPYPREKLHHAWELVLGGQFHDILPGTALPKAFEYSWNDEIIAMNSFASALQDAVGGVARGLDTRGDGTPLVVYNPLSVAREDVVEAELEFPTPPATISVSDGDGKAVPAQILGTMGNKCRFEFLAKVPPIGFAVFSVSAAGGAPASSPELKVTDRSLENDRYRVTVNDAGDIASVFDKTAKRELLDKPARLAYLTEYPDEWPAWNMYWKDRKNPPRGYVEGPAKITVAENGPARIALQVHRESEGSIIDQTIRLGAGGAGDRVEIANVVDWQGKACSFKADFPLTVANLSATYNWELGKIQRLNNDEKKFEVPSHQWFDLTDLKGDYGVSILTDFKYGSDKPADNELRLTLLYTPGLCPPFYEQRWQDWGRHEFTYGIYGHAGDWRQGKSDWQALRLSQPLMAFRTAPHEGKLGRSFSLLHLDSEQVAVRAVKLAENGDKLIVRLQELNGAPASAVTLTAAAGVSNVQETTGMEIPLHAVESPSGVLKLDFKPFQLRTLAMDIQAPAKLDPPSGAPVDLPYNVAAFTTAGSKNGTFDSEGRSLPAEMIGDTVTADGVAFKIGPRDAAKNSAVICKGQSINLPAGAHNRLYLLASAVDGDVAADFKVDDHTTKLNVQNWSGYIGQWDTRVFQGDIPETANVFQNVLDHISTGFIKRDPLAWFASHRHLKDGRDGIYQYSYIFKYRLDIGNDAKKLTLPDNARIRVFAASVAQDDNDATVPAHPLYDDFTGRKPIELRVRP